MGALGKALSYVFGGTKTALEQVLALPDQPTLWLAPETIAHADTASWDQPLDFSNVVWTANEIGTPVGGQADPNGGTDAYLITETANTSVHRWLGDIPNVVDSGRSFSITAKDVDLGFVYIRDTGTGGGTVWFNVASGTLGTVSGTGVSGTIEALPGGWYRCTAFFPTTTVAQLRYGFSRADNTLAYTVTGGDERSMLVYQAEVSQPLVTSWDAYQGSTLSLDQATAANRPAYIASEPTLNGKACVHKDTTTKFLQEVTTGALGTPTDMTVFIVGVGTNLTTGLASFELLSGGQYQEHLSDADGSGVDYRSSWDGTAHSEIGPTVLGAQVATTVYDASAGARTYYANGAAVGAFAYDGAISLTSKIQHGANGGAHGAGSKTCEIIVIKAALSDEHRRVWENYLAAKYNQVITVLSPFIETLRRRGKVDAIFCADLGRTEVNAVSWDQPYDLSNAAWAKNNVTATFGAQDADGGSQATRVDETAVSSIHCLIDTPNATEIGVRTYRIRAKADTLDWIYIRDETATNGIVFFDVASGAVGTETEGTGTITALGNGWFLCEATFENKTAAQAQCRIGISRADNTQSHAVSPGDERGLWLYFAEVVQTRVSTWTDQGPWSRTATNVTAAQHPKYLTSGPNGRGYLHSDGIDDNLTAGFAPNAPQPFRTITVGICSRSGAANQVVVGGFDQFNLAMYSDATPAVAMFSGGNVPSAVTTVSSWHMADCAHNGVSSSIAVDDGSPATGNAGTNDGNGIRFFANYASSAFGDANCAFHARYYSTVADPTQDVGAYYGIAA